MSTHHDLRSANIARQKEWDTDNRISLAYRGNELAGEVGEACNVIKKIERERLGIVGSRDTITHLAEELADVVICADLIAMHEGIDLLGEAVPAKFNATSEKVGLVTRLSAQQREPVVRAAAERVLAEAERMAMTMRRRRIFEDLRRALNAAGDDAAEIEIPRQRENVLSQHEVRPGSTSPGAEQQCDTLCVTTGRDRQQIQSSDVEACRDCSEASRRDSREPESSMSDFDQYRKSIDRINNATDREIWSGDIQSSDGGVESRPGRARKQKHDERLDGASEELADGSIPSAAGVAPGPSEAIDDVSVEKMEWWLDEISGCNSLMKSGSKETYFGQIAKAVDEIRALLARYRIGRRG